MQPVLPHPPKPVPSLRQWRQDCSLGVWPLQETAAKFKVTAHPNHRGLLIQAESSPPVAFPEAMGPGRGASSPNDADWCPGAPCPPQGFCPPPATPALRVSLGSLRYTCFLVSPSAVRVTALPPHAGPAPATLCPVAWLWAPPARGIWCWGVQKEAGRHSVPTHLQACFVLRSENIQGV